ncbi:MAG: hypothetical protein ACKOW8_05885, partial [Flavobacteriales bacterium]
GHFCNDPIACNYYSCSVTASNCSYSTTTEVQFYAELFDTSSFGFLDTLLGNVGYVEIQGTGLTFLPDETGSIVISGLDSGSVYTLNFVPTSGAWQAQPLTISYPSCQTQYYALTSPEQEASASVQAPVQWWNNTMHCIGGFYPVTTIYNTGSTTVSGTYTVSYNATLVVDTGYYAFNDNIAIEAGSLTWDIAAFNPDEFINLPVHFNGPGSAYTGSIFPFTYSLVLRDDLDSVFYENSWNTGVLVTCSYDPNDKSAQPVGYTDQHYLAAGEELEYRIRFQNTGNAVAFDVVIEDEIDTALFELDSLEVIGFSHPLVTELSGDTVRFIFNDIMLPDSASDEAGSQGFVVFRIPMNGNEQTADTLRNTASIYFDDNAPIITNTVEHVVYDCSLMSDIVTIAQACVGEELNLSADTTFTNTFVWSLNGDTLATGALLEHAWDSSDTYVVYLTRSNPICSRTDSVTIDVVVCGCTDSTACNYNPLATEDDGSCGDTLGLSCDDNDTTTVNDVIGTDCVCAGEQIPVSGCTDSTACNYDPTVGILDSTLCEFPPSQPDSTNCWDLFILVDSTCSWINIGTQPQEPATACYETTTFNSETCSWEVTGTQPEEPVSSNCWDSFVFDTDSCQWFNEGIEPVEPEIQCFETVGF